MMNIVEALFHFRWFEGAKLLEIGSWQLDTYQFGNKNIYIYVFSIDAKDSIDQLTSRILTSWTSWEYSDLKDRVCGLPLLSKVSSLAFRDFNGCIDSVGFIGFLGSLVEDGCQWPFF